MERAIQDPLERAIDLLGGITRLARALGLGSHAVVHQWRSNRVPAERCPSIERVTNGAVRCEELRPDVDWGYLRNGGAPSTSSSAMPETNALENRNAT